MREAFRAANILRKKLWNFANFLSIRLAAPDSTWAILDFLGNFGCPSWLYTIEESIVEANAMLVVSRLPKLSECGDWSTSQLTDGQMGLQCAGVDNESDVM